MAPRMVTVDFVKEIARATAEMELLRKRIDLLEMEDSLMDARVFDPHAGVDALTELTPRFRVLFSNGLVKDGQVERLVRFTVTAGSWWRRGVEYRWDKAIVAADTWELGRSFVVAKLCIPPEGGDDPTCQVEVVKSADWPPKDKDGIDLDQKDYRVLATLFMVGEGAARTTRIWQRWFSDIYDGGDDLPADWDCGTVVFEEGTGYQLDVEGGHVHVHGKGFFSIDEPTTVNIDVEDGYVYLYVDLASGSITVLYAGEFPESTPTIATFALYRVEGHKVVRDLRTAPNFGSPI